MTAFLTRRFMLISLRLNTCDHLLGGNTCNMSFELPVLTTDLARHVEGQ